MIDAQKEYYLIGSLRNPKISELAKEFETGGIKIFSSWFCASENADDSWKQHEQSRGLTFEEALEDYAACHVFEFDRYHLSRCDGAILVLPTGKSGHLELGWILGKGKPGYILLEDDKDRWDVMYKFANGIGRDVDTLIKKIKKDESESSRTIFGYSTDPGRDDSLWSGGYKFSNPKRSTAIWLHDEPRAG